MVVCVVFPPPGQTAEQGAKALLEAARKNARARGNYLVASSYLERWAVGGKIRITETDTDKSYCQAPDAAAKEKDFYSLKADELDPDVVPPALIETILSRVEGSAKELVDLLISGGPGVLDEFDALSFATFLGFQLTRGRAFRARLQDLANRSQLLFWEDIADEGIAQRLRENGQDADSGAVAGIRQFLEEWKAGRYSVRMPPAAEVFMASAEAHPVAMNLLARPFRIYRSPMPLITCDEPVVPLPLPGHDLRSEPGIATAGTIVFPLDPHHLLAMFHPYLALDELALWPELLPSETDEINLALAAHSDRWLFEQANRTRTNTLLVPRQPPERVMTKVVASGETEEGFRELIRAGTPNRWWSASRPPDPPLGRWWRGVDTFPGAHEVPYDVTTMPHALFNALG